MMNGLVRRLKDAMPLGGIKEICGILWDSGKMILMSIFLMNVGFMSVVACGHLGKLQLDGVSLASSTINVIGISMAWGLGSAFDTFFSQAYGSHDKKNVGVFLQTGLIFFGALCLFCLSIYVNSYSILVALGQDPQVARIAEEYLLYFSPGLPFVLVFMILAKYLQAQNIVNALLVIEIVSCVLNVGLQYLLVYVAGLGVRGSAISHAVCFFTMFLLLVVFMLLSGVHRETWPAWTLDCLEGWGKISKLVMSALILVCIDWWGIEVGLFLIGSLGVVPLGAAGISFQFMQLMFGIAQGGAMQWVYRIGQCLGRGDADSARRNTNACIVITLCVSLILFLVMMSFMTVVPRLFTSNSEIQNLATRLFPLAALFLLVDSIKSQLSGIIRGCGKQFQAAVISFALLTVLTFAIAVPLTYLTTLKAMGYWIGAVIGGGLCSLCFIVILIRIDWPEEIVKAAERIRIRQAKIEKKLTESSLLLAKKGNNNTSLFELALSDTGIIPQGDNQTCPPNVNEDASDFVGDRKLGWLLTTRMLICLAFVGLFAASVTCRVLLSSSGGYSMVNGTSIDHAVNRTIMSAGLT